MDAPVAVEAVVDSGDERVDRVVRAVVGTLTRLLPGQVRSCYLLGSHAESASHAASDVDLAVLLDDGVRRDRLLQAIGMCTATSPIHLDVMAVTGNELIELYPGFVPVLKVTNRLVWGEDLAATLPWPDVERYTEHSVALAMACMSAIRNLPAVPEPLEYPDPDGEFFGYDSRIAGVTLAPRQRLRGLVALASRVAIAVVGVRSGKFCTSREEHLRLYREASNSGFADLLEQVIGHCRNDWRYEVPGSHDDRAVLRAMCHEILSFERASLAEFDTSMRSRTLIAG